MQYAPTMAMDPTHQAYLAAAAGAAGAGAAGMTEEQQKQMWLAYYQQVQGVVNPMFAGYPMYGMVPVPVSVDGDDAGGKKKKKDKKDKKKSSKKKEKKAAESGGEDAADGADADAGTPPSTEPAAVAVS
ncbi:hypothetical protein HK102_009282 [Quaeritorhiza haematococci]|nr:hypothetical protein HK102_009282 [Quaeritorhiza haematococci]